MGLLPTDNPCRPSSMMSSSQVIAAFFLLFRSCESAEESVVDLIHHEVHNYDVRNPNTNHFEASEESSPTTNSGTFERSTRKMLFLATSFSEGTMEERCIIDANTATIIPHPVQGDQRLPSKDIHFFSLLLCVAL